jgi:hypothetical protein
MGLSVEVVRKPPKPVPEEVAKVWAKEWAKEGKQIYWRRLMPPARVRGLTPQVGGGEDFLVVISESEDEQGVREAVRQRRSVHLCGHGPSAGEEVGSCLRIIKQFRKGSAC